MCPSFSRHVLTCRCYRTYCRWYMGQPCSLTFFHLRLVYQCTTNLAVTLNLKMMYCSPLFSSLLLLITVISFSPNYSGIVITFSLTHCPTYCWRERVGKGRREEGEVVIEREMKSGGTYGTIDAIFKSNSWQVWEGDLGWRREWGACERRREVIKAAHFIYPYLTKG